MICNTVPFQPSYYLLDSKIICEHPFPIPDISTELISYMQTNYRPRLAMHGKFMTRKSGFLDLVN